MNKTKQIYETPQIEEVRLDREISLVLVSLPPGGPDEGMNNLQAPDFFNANEPVKA